MSRIAVMQPYFLPYAGYFRLLVDVEAFVVGDVQQFPRRGWVHRNRLIDDRGELGWLTLPIRPQSLDTQIRDIDFADGAQTTLNRNMARFAACRATNAATEPIMEELRALQGRPKDLIIGLIQRVAKSMGIATPILLQSELSIGADLSATDQICAICAALNAKEYVNAPGGRALYNEADFRRRGVQLLFLPPYRGSWASILQRLTDEPATELRREIIANTTVERA
jgi:hypothetical protein